MATSSISAAFAVARAPGVRLASGSRARAAVPAAIARPGVLASLTASAFAGTALKTGHAAASARGGRSGLVVEAKKKKYVGSLDGKGLRIALVVGRFNDLVTKLLLEGAEECFERHGVSDSDVDIVWVPGSFELPVVTKSMAESGKYDAVMAIGAVVRGSTTHYEAVAGAADSGILNASMSSGIPCIFGVLTTENMEQALDRAGGKAGNKGYECAVTCIEMANLMKQLRADGKAAPPSFA